MLARQTSRKCSTSARLDDASCFCLAAGQGAGWPLDVAGVVGGGWGGASVWDKWQESNAPAGSSGTETVHYVNNKTKTKNTGQQYLNIVVALMKDHTVRNHSCLRPHFVMKDHTV